MTTRRILIGFIVMLVSSTAIVAAPVTAELVEVRKIWDRAPHNAFTDLIRWRDRFYCCFREGLDHASNYGKIRILVSSDGEKWSSAGLLAMDDWDLRDPHLCAMGDGRLMVIGGACHASAGRGHAG